MMRITFVAHSGLLVELPSAALLFDWWKEELPPLPDGKPLLVFSSHRHKDHFKPEIFTLEAHAFLLGNDIRLTARNREKWGLSDETAAKCIRMGKRDTVSPLPGITVETLPSTDEGVAFLVTADGKAIFHAGDLNWWHWEGEDPAWNQNMAVDFKKYTEPLRGRHLDLAMLPLDPRLGEQGFWGPRYLLELADIACMLPMHQWEDFAFTDKFLAAYPAYQDKVLPVRENGQVFTL